MSDTDKITKLKNEIAKLEKQISESHFASIVDRARNEKQQSRLRKLRRELKTLEEGQ